MKREIQAWSSLTGGRFNVVVNVLRCAAAFAICSSTSIVAAESGDDVAIVAISLSYYVRA